MRNITKPFLIVRRQLKTRGIWPILSTILKKIGHYR
jgi:hypothetical protein